MIYQLFDAFRKSSVNKQQGEKDARSKLSFKICQYLRMLVLFFFFLWKISAANSQGLKRLERSVALESPQLPLQAKNLRPITVNSNNGINSVQVLSDSPVFSSIGVVSVANSNWVCSLVPSGNLNDWLQETVATRLNGLYPNEQLNAVLAIHRFSIGQDSSGRYSFLHLNADIYGGNTTGSFSLVNRLDTVFSSTVIDSAYRGLFDSSASYLCQRIRNGNGTLAGSTTVSIDQIKAAVKDMQGIPILNDSLYKSGIYLSWDEYKSNQPSVPFAGITVDSTDNHIGLYGYKEGKPILFSDAWGMCRNGEMYILKNGKLLPIEVVGKEIVISRYYDPAKRNNQGMYYREYLGVSLISNNPFSHSNIVTVPVRDKPSGDSPEATRIDMLTGEPTF